MKKRPNSPLYIDQTRKFNKTCAFFITFRKITNAYMKLLVELRNMFYIIDDIYAPL